MSQQPFEPQHRGSILTRIYEGMAVYDCAGQKIGTVEQVYVGAVGEKGEKRGGPAGARESSVLEDCARAIVVHDQVPEPLYAHACSAMASSKSIAWASPPPTAMSGPIRSPTSPRIASRCG
jgi:hypothetical protein